MNLDVDLTRREFLEISTAVVAAFAELRIRTEVSAKERATLVAVVRDLFSHPGSGEATYAQAATVIIDRCRRDAMARVEVTQGLTILNRCCAGRYATASDRRRFAALTMLRDGGFFRTVYGEALEAVYGRRDAWRLYVGRL